jgi:hypothetical protein
MRQRQGKARQPGKTRQDGTREHITGQDNPCLCILENVCDFHCRFRHIVYLQQVHTGKGTKDEEHKTKNDIDKDNGTRHMTQGKDTRHKTKTTTQDTRQRQSHKTKTQTQDTRYKTKTTTQDTRQRQQHKTQGIRQTQAHKTKTQTQTRNKDNYTKDKEHKTTKR